jgi:hypothetical protein
VLLGREGRDEMEDGLGRDAVLESEPRSFGEDVEQFVRIVRREDHLLVREARPHAGIQVLRELEVVRYADDRHAGLRQVVVDLQELVQDVVAVLLHDLVDLVQHDDHDPLLLVELLEEQGVDAVRRQARERDALSQVFDEPIPDRLEDAVRRVDDLAVQVEILDHPGAVRLAELVLDVLHDGRLATPGLPEDQDVARSIALEGRHQDLRQLVDVALPVRQAVRDVRRTQDLPVHLVDRPRPQIWLEDAFFHGNPVSP